METKQILKDIGKRCQGDIYLGIVGPVRSGKSTLLKDLWKWRLFLILKILM